LVDGAGDIGAAPGECRGVPANPSDEMLYAPTRSPVKPGIS